MKRTILTSSIVAVLSGGSALWGQATQQPQEPGFYSQEVVDAAMAKLRAAQAIREAAAATQPAEERAAEQQRRSDRDELMRVRRQAQAAENENDQLRRQMAQLSGEVREMRLSMQQVQDTLEQARAMMTVQREYAPTYDTQERGVYISDGNFFVNPRTGPVVIPPLGVVGSATIPPPSNALNPARTPRNTLNPALTPRNFNRTGPGGAGPRGGQ